MTLPEGATFSTGSIQGRYTTGATITYPATFKVSVGDMIVKPGYTQTVKLNVNVVKSQKGDLNPTPTEFQTVKYAGTDGQGNPFSYDIVIK